MSDYEGNPPEPMGRATDITAPDGFAAHEELLLVGGKRHGEMVTIVAGAKSFVDLLSAQTYYRNGFDFVRPSPENPRSQLLRRGYHAEAMVHESIHADRQQANAWWQSLALQRLFEAHGVEVPVEEIIRKYASPGTAPGAAQN